MKNASGKELNAYDLYRDLLNSPVMAFAAKDQMMNAVHLIQDGEYTITVAGQSFNIGQIPHGQFKDKWVWSTETSESLPFASPLEAEKDAARYVAQQAQDECDEAEETKQVRLYGDSATSFL